MKWRFWRHFFLNFFACAGAISATLQFTNILFPAWTYFQGIHTLLAVILISLVVGLFLSWPRPIEAAYNAPNMRIRIIKGDILKQNEHLVVGTCDTFDTETPIIAKESLQGQALDVLFGGDRRDLDEKLSAALHGKAIEGKIDKEGKTQLYGIGSVAVVKHGGRNIFFLAYCRMNQSNEARASIDDVWKSLLSLWGAISTHGNGKSVSIPVIGGGQARLSSVLPAQDSIRFIILSFMFASRKEKICDELRIVVRDRDYEKLDRLELQSFLSSLRPS